MPLEINNNLPRSKSKKELVVGSHSYSKNVTEPSGHFNKSFYLQELKWLHPNYFTAREHIRIYNHFIERYPTLNDWFKDDLLLRVGRLSEDTFKKAQCNLAYRSRYYIYQLCLFGLPLDYPYLFSIRRIDTFYELIKKYDVDYGITAIEQTVEKLKYHKYGSFADVRWVFYRIMMHTQKKHYTEITLEDLNEFEQASRIYCAEQYVHFWSHSEKPNIYRVTASIYRLHLILYTLGVTNVEPRKHYMRAGMLDENLSHLKHPKIANVLVAYKTQISLSKEKQTVDKTLKTLNQFAKWLEQEHNQINNLNKLTRNIAVQYLQYLQDYVSTRTGKNYSQSHLCCTISTLKVFLEESLAFGYQDVPQYKILFSYDTPRKPRPLPRYIPDADLNHLMVAVKSLPCPYQRNALILLRWSGARREEIRRLDDNALDYYTDGTPKLFIPIGKTNESRWIPIHKEAETAFKELKELRQSSGNLKGLSDRKTGKLTDYLFMRKNSMLSGQYLFDSSMRRACELANLVTDEGKLKYTSHQFRHTIGTQMANQGASLPTIMKMLGHQSPDMTIRYTQIFDETLKKDYQCAIGKDAIIAGGEYAEQLKNQELRQDEIDWIKTNFHKTYLAMGHCFHHVHEPMCDFVDACYFCPKFVTTENHLPKLLDKYQVELQLIEDAKTRNWEKEVERHSNVAVRVKKIIADLGIQV